MAATELLQKAKAAIASGEKNFREAAEYIANAQRQGVSQRFIAGEIGKSVGWVNGLLKWRRGGYIGDAFDRAHRKKLVQPAEQRATYNVDPAPERERADDPIGASAQFDIRDPEVLDQLQTQLQKRLLNVSARERLVKALGMLGSTHDGEVLNAARMVERVRHSLNMTWEELLVTADEVDFDIAA
jgi:hypothetical protein